MNRIALAIGMAGFSVMIAILETWEDGANTFAYIALTLMVLVLLD